jgi:hypothetical protein
VGVAMISLIKACLVGFLFSIVFSYLEVLLSTILIKLLFFFAGIGALLILLIRSALVSFIYLLYQFGRPCQPFLLK